MLTHTTRCNTNAHIHSQKHQTRTEAHPPRKPEQKTECTLDNHSEVTHIPDNHSAVSHTLDAPAMAPVNPGDDINLESIPVHLLGVHAIKKGAPIGCGGMSTVFNGKYGPIPVALKQAASSALLNEAQIITKMHHPNVIRVFGIWKNAEEQIFMVFITILISIANIVVEVANLTKTLLVVHR